MLALTDLNAVLDFADEYESLTATGAIFEDRVPSPSLTLTMLGIFLTGAVGGLASAALLGFRKAAFVPLALAAGVFMALCTVVLMVEWLQIPAGQGEIRIRTFKFYYVPAAVLLIIGIMGLIPTGKAHLGLDTQARR